MKDFMTVSYDPFARESRVFAYKDGRIQSTQVCSALPELTQTIANLAWGFGINDVKISAPDDIVDELRESVHQYSNNNINIEAI